MMKADNDLPEATAEFETADRNVNLFIGYLPCVKPTMPEVKRRHQALSLRSSPNLTSTASPETSLNFANNFSATRNHNPASETLRQ
jgi:hypothetical protein